MKKQQFKLTVYVSVTNELASTHKFYKEDSEGAIKFIKEMIKNSSVCYGYAGARVTKIKQEKK